MADFKFEVLTTYSEKDNLKVRSVSFNDREPKFDIRHWNEKDGKEVMGKGVTLTIEELQYLADTLPKVVAELTGGTKKTTKTKAKAKVEEESLLPTEEDDEVDKTSDTLNEKADKFVKYLIKNAPEDFKGVNVADKVTFATNGKVICALSGTNDEVTIIKKDIKSTYDKVIPNDSDLTEIKAALVKKVKDSTIKMLKKGTTFSFGKGYNLVNAEYVGKAIRAVGENAKLYTNKANNFYIAKGDNGTVVICAKNEKGGAVGLQKTA